MAEKLLARLGRAGEGGGAERIGALGAELTELLRADPLASLPPHLFLLGRVLGMLAGVSTQLGVRVNIARALLPNLFAATGTAR